MLLTDPVDEIWVGSVSEFDGKPLQSVAKGEVDLDSEDDKAAHEAERQEQERDFADLLTWLRETLSDHVKAVRLSTRLTESLACLITDTFSITPALARIYQAAGQAAPVGKRILERNPNHPLVTGASALQEIDLLREELSKGAASSAQACTAAKPRSADETHVTICDGIVAC